ncbi:MAG: SDR family oxidoreductase [Acidimicrobiales bacterium]|nr:SDR family oxidoreductase [Acidimicrobiales bacterium]
MDLQLEGKRAIVTGGSRGIGRAVALGLAGEGVDVALAARNADALDAAAAEIAAETGRRIVPLVCDTSSDESVRAMVDSAVEALGGVDILVNSAAIPAGAPVPPLEDITEEYIWADMNVKVLGYLRCAQAVAPHMKAQQWGRIINISGLGARLANSIVGSMRNVSVAALTKNLADMLGPHGINVTVVHPGATRTESALAILAERASERGVSLDDLVAEVATSNSIRHFLEPEEVAWVVTFLASPRSISITGDAVVTGGGVGNAIYY